MNLSPPLIDVLSVVEKHGPMTISAISRHHLLITKGAARSRIQRLERLGLVMSLGITWHDAVTYAITRRGEDTTKALYGPCEHLYGASGDTEEHLSTEHGLTDVQAATVASGGVESIAQMHALLHEQPPYDES